jgi:colanic acid/amylovoran biosynthesis glycosyltransferase
MIPSARLVLIVPSFPKLSEAFLVGKFLGLLNLGWDVLVFCAESQTVEWKQFPELELCPQAHARVRVSWRHRPRWLTALLTPVAILFSACRNPRGTRRYLFQGLRQFGLALVLRRFYLDASLVALAPDLVHFEFGALAVGRMHLKPLLGCRVTASFRGYDLNLCGWEKTDYYSDVWDQTDAVHFLSAALWQQAQRRGCPRRKIYALIPPAIDVDRFATGTLAPSEPTTDRPLQIVSVGRLTWEKGYEYAIEAIHLLIRQGIRAELRILGSGSLLESLAFARRQWGVESSVQFLGAGTRAQVRQALLGADVFLHASVSEGFGNAVLEAQAMALPVVCSDAGGLPENVADGESGWVVPRRNAQALAEKLAVLARDPALRRRMGAAGRQRVIKHFQINDQLHAFDAFYRRVLADGSQTL